MGEYKFKPVDFDNPSLFPVLEDILKGLVGGHLLCNPYFRASKLRGNEKILDFACGGGAGTGVRAGAGTGSAQAIRGVPQVG